MKDIYLTLDGQVIKDESHKTTMQMNISKELGCSVRNLEMRLAKSVQVGLIFPTNFLIEEKDYYSIYRDQRQGQIVRYEVSSIHGNTDHVFNPLIITPLERGEYKIRTFVKAENIEATYTVITIKVN